MHKLVILSQITVNLYISLFQDLFYQRYTDMPGYLLCIFCAIFPKYNTTKLFLFLSFCLSSHSQRRPINILVDESMTWITARWNETADTAVLPIREYVRARVNACVRACVHASIRACTFTINGVYASRISLLYTRRICFYILCTIKIFVTPSTWLPLLAGR